MPSLPRQQPFHEPVGLSPEDDRVSRRWLLTMLAGIAVLAAGLITLFRLTA